MKGLNIQALYRFLSRLNKREKIVFYGTVFFISLALLDRLIIYPIFSRIQGLNKEIEAKKAGITRSLHILAHEDRISEESAKYSSFSISSKSSEEEVTLILKEIESLASKSSVYLVDMKPRESRGTESPKTYFISLNCEGQMEHIIELMYNIESSDKMLTVDSYDISPKEKESTIARCTMSISKFVIP